MQVDALRALSGEAKARRVAGLVRRRSFMQRYVLDLDNRDSRQRELAELWCARCGLGRSASNVLRLCLLHDRLLTQRTEKQRTYCRVAVMQRLAVYALET